MLVPSPTSHVCQPLPQPCLAWSAFIPSLCMFLWVLYPDPASSQLPAPSSPKCQMSFYQVNSAFQPGLVCCYPALLKTAGCYNSREVSPQNLFKSASQIWFSHVLVDAVPQPFVVHSLPQPGMTPASAFVCIERQKMMPFNPAKVSHMCRCLHLTQTCLLISPCKPQLPHLSASVVAQSVEALISHFFPVKYVLLWSHSNKFPGPILWHLKNLCLGDTVACSSLISFLCILLYINIYTYIRMYVIMCVYMHNYMHIHIIAYNSNSAGTIV